MSLFEDPRSRLLSSDELGEYLHKSRRAVHRLAKDRIIPSIRLGGSFRFRLVDVEKALERYSEEAT